jgi:hypothetical protein
LACIFEARSGIKAVLGPFLARALDAVVYPDLPEWLVVGEAVLYAGRYSVCEKSTAKTAWNTEQQALRKSWKGKDWLLFFPANKPEGGRFKSAPATILLPQNGFTIVESLNSLARG